MEFSNLNGYDVKDKVARQEMNTLNDSYYEEITYKKGRLYNTDYYVTYIPKFDSENKQIDFHVEEKDYSGQSPLKHAQENYTSLTLNCSLAILNDNDQFVGEIVIGDGVVLDSTSQYGASYVPDNYLYVGIKADRSIEDFKINATTLEQLQNAGCLNVFGAYFKLINNSSEVDLTGVMVNGEDIVTTKHPRQVLGIKSDGTIVILTCDGRSHESEGLTASELQEILLEENCVNAWNLDGGGSSSTIIKGSKLNRNIDDKGTTDRELSWTLNVKKPEVNEGIAKAYSKIGEEKQNIIQQLIPWVRESRLSVDPSYINNSDLDELIGKIYFAYGRGLSNAPTSNASGYVINIPHADEEYKDTYNQQIFLYRDSLNMFIRNQVNGVFTNWIPVNGKLIANLIPSSHNSITTTHSYQSLKFGSINGSDHTKNYIKYDETTIDQNNEYSAFKINKVGFFNIRVNLGLYSTSAEDKYIKITKNGSDISNAIIKKDMESSKDNIIYLETLINNGNVTDVYEVKIYGTQSDSVTYGSVIVECV